MAQNPVKGTVSIFLGGLGIIAAVVSPLSLAIAPELSYSKYAFHLGVYFVGLTIALHAIAINIGISKRAVKLTDYLYYSLAVVGIVVAAGSDSQTRVQALIDRNAPTIIAGQQEGVPLLRENCASTELSSPEMCACLDRFHHLAFHSYHGALYKNYEGNT